MGANIKVHSSHGPHLIDVRNVDCLTLVSDEPGDTGAPGHTQLTLGLLDFAVRVDVEQL